MGQNDCDCNCGGMNRRDFVTAAAAAAAGLGLVAAAGLPALGQATTQPSTPEPIDIGMKTDFAKDGVSTTWVRSHHIVVARADSKLFAMSSKCTHKGCDVADASGQLHCPCHNSDFAYDGSNVDGPAKRPLPRYAISTNADGHVMVDMGEQFKTADSWTDPKSFVKLDA